MDDAGLSVQMHWKIEKLQKSDMSMCIGKISYFGME